MTPVTPQPSTPVDTTYKVGSYQKKVYTLASLNCRTGRGDAYGVITTLGKGSHIPIWFIDKAKDGQLWGSTTCASKTGFVDLKYTSPNKPSTFKVGSYQKKVNTLAKLNCRTGRGDSYSLITTIA